MEIDLLHPDYDDEDSVVAKSVVEAKKIAHFKKKRMIG